MSAPPSGPAPRATYRLQLHAGFDFDAATALVPYLAELGISHVYCSPVLQAAVGSSHGYDVVDHGAVSRELGGEEGFGRLVGAAHEHGLGIVLDLVPNHMAIGGPQNRWWWDVLEHGQASRYAAYFDIDWDPPERRLRNVILLPVLADHYGRVLEAGGIRLAWDGEAFTVETDAASFPLDPRSLGPLLTEAAQAAGSDDLELVAAALGELPPSTLTDCDSVERRQSAAAVLLSDLRGLAANAPMRRAIDAAVARLNLDPDRLDALLMNQNYRLAHWRSSDRDLGYRRFFDIDTLIGLRTERTDVFDDTHRLVLGWLAGGSLDGLRIDHPDGLRDPKAYLARLAAAAPDAWIVVEKILAPGEALRADWPVAGTTGYDFLNEVLSLFVESRAADALARCHAELTGETADWNELSREMRLLVLRQALGSDLNRLSELFVEICESNRRYRDFTRHQLHETLAETIAAFGVYRSYVRAGTGEVAVEDRRVVEHAIERARAHRSDLDPELFDFLRRILLLEMGGRLGGELAMRFQQLTPATMAKGVEDTAIYRYGRLVALNEVGGDPSRFGLDVHAFHRAAASRGDGWPTAMLSTSSHDTKRGEDVRVRLALLSQLPDEWCAAVRGWSALAARHRDDAGRFDRGAEYLFHQVLVGAWPIGVERMLAYMEKATREAKAHTSWTAPDEAYDAARDAFVRGAMADTALMASVEAFVERLSEGGWCASLGQALIKLTAPGVPDLYQGTELWDLTLVDPDNRRPIDFELRRRLLDELDGLEPAAVWRRAVEGLPKLWVTHQALGLRARRPELFAPRAAYRPLSVGGETLAFVRGEAAITVAPLRPLHPPRGVLDLPGGEWRNLLGGQLLSGRVSLADLLEPFPVALLERT